MDKFPYILAALFVAIDTLTTFVGLNLYHDLYLQRFGYFNSILELVENNPRIANIMTLAPLFEFLFTMIGIALIQVVGVFLAKDSKHLLQVTAVLCYLPALTLIIPIANNLYLLLWR